MKRAIFFVVLGLVASPGAWAQFSGFGGPSVLGRSGGAGIGRRSAAVRMRFFGSVQGVYDSGLTAYDGNPTNLGQSGVQVRGGVYGQKSWGRTDLSLAYIGGYRAYTGNSNLNGVDQTMTLGISHSLNKRTFIQTSNTFWMMNRAYGYGYGFITPAQQADPAFAPVPTQDIYDSTTITVSNYSTLGYLFSPRVSVAASGGIFNTHRTDGLVSTLGVSANGDISYRLSRTQTLTVAYNFNQYNYSGAYGNSVINMLSLAYGWQSRRWGVNFMAGGAKLVTEGVRLVQIDPAVAAIVGITQGREAFYKVNYFPTFRAMASSRFRRSTVGVSAYRQILPGNGVTLTSMTVGGYVYLSYTGIRKWTFTARGSAYRFNGIGRFYNNTNTYEGGGQVGYQIRNDLQFNASVLYRDQKTTDSSFNRGGVRVSVGLSYSPGEIPLALW